MFRVVKVKKWEEAWSLGMGLTLWSFRGHADNQWRLQSSLERSLEKFASLGRLMKNREEWMLRQFMRRAHHYLDDLPSDDSRIEWLSIMQHHGAPTRLVDATYSFPVAAFFAVEKPAEVVSVWAFNLKRFYEVVRSRTGQGLSDERIDQVQDRCLLLVREFLSGAASGRLVIPVEPWRMNDRLSIQKGMFMFPSDITLSFEQNLADTFGWKADVFTSTEAEDYTERAFSRKELEQTEVLKIILPGDILRRARGDLWQMNVSAASLFPGLDGFARSLGYYVALK